MHDAAMSSARKPARSAVSAASVPATDPVADRASDRGTVLAFDFGAKYTGVAAGEAETRLAHPLPAIRAARSEARFDAIARLLVEWRPARLVVGLPLATDGSAHAMTLRARRFARQLEGRFRIAVTLVDERYSSVEAESRLRADPHAMQRSVDSMAAQVILQQYFDERGR